MDACCTAAAAAGYFKPDQTLAKCIFIVHALRQTPGWYLQLRGHQRIYYA